MIYFVSTPIGNLKDISLRALEVLQSVHVIACEDTRTSLKLLNHFDIHTKLISYHKFNETNSADGIIMLAKEGKDIAIISDAGTPGISDPGYILINKLRENNIQFSVIPGANALLPALLLSGKNPAPFLFIGFLPEKNSERKALLEEISLVKATLVFYVSPHKLMTELSFLFELLGARQACLVKEITKINESAYNFNLGDEIDINVRGEFVLVVEGFTGVKNENLNNLPVLEHFNFYINLGNTKNNAIKLVAKDRNVKKDIIYKEIIKS